MFRCHRDGDDNNHCQFPAGLCDGGTGREDVFSPRPTTKTYALASAFILGLILLPTLSYLLFSVRINSKMIRKVANYLLVAAGIVLLVIYGSIPALGLTAVGVNNLFASYWKNPKMSTYINIGITLLVAIYYLSEEWLPDGGICKPGLSANILFVAACILIILSLLWDIGYLL